MNTPTPQHEEWSEEDRRFAALLQQEPKIVTPACYEPETLLDLIADESDTPDAAQMWAHITGCAHCVAEFAALSKAYQTAGKPSLAYRWRSALSVCRMAGKHFLAASSGFTRTAEEAGARPVLLGMNRYQWVVLFAAWLGWGFDMFDATLFNHVAHSCIPALLHIPFGSPEAASQVSNWLGILTSALLLSWAMGGVLFGWLADRIGRARTLTLTILLYAVGTACCAFAPNIWVLLLFRVISGMGIGGEWAAGASIVAETVPEERRVQAGTLLYTAAPVGLFLATFANAQIAGNLFKGDPDAWRYVFLCGLIPAAFAFLVRRWVKEPEGWTAATAAASHKPRLRELFEPANFRATRSGLITSLMALIAWWSCYAFIPVVAKSLAIQSVSERHFDRFKIDELAEQYKALAANSFHWGGLLGILLMMVAAKYMGRRNMFNVYFLCSTAALFATFGLNLPAETLLRMYFFLGVTVFGVFGSFTYYLPELFPTRLRATGSGFCYNIGRILAAVGTFWVGHVAAGGLEAVLRALYCIGFVLLFGLLFLPWIVETYELNPGTPAPPPGVGTGPMLPQGGTCG